MSLIKMAGENHEHLIKEAVLGLLAGVGKVLVHNPLHTVGLAFDASHAAGGAKKFNQTSRGMRDLVQDAAARVPPVSM